MSKPKKNIVIVLAVLAAIWLLVVLVARFAIQPAAVRASGGCYRATANKSVDGKLVGLVNLGKFYGGKMTIDYCTNGTRIYTYSSGPAVTASVSTLGHATGWDYEDVDWAAGPKLKAKAPCFGCLKVKRALKFTQLVPGSTG